MTTATTHTINTAVLDNIKVFELDGFSLIAVKGEDAASFLQGQLTCDIRKISATQASIAAFCNAKGRAITVLAVVKRQDEFILILPESLLGKVFSKLRMYVLRSKVTLEANPAHLKLIGLLVTAQAQIDITLPTTDFRAVHADATWIKLPGIANRYFGLLQTDTTSPGYLQAADSGSMEEWRYDDISVGLPWFDEPQSEQHIPQALNIDQLGGISFEKGCYTGQEIIARTHYLGKIKRQLVLAECDGYIENGTELSVMTEADATKSGDVLVMQNYQEKCRMLIVCHSVVDTDKSLILGDQKSTPIRVIPF